MAHVHADAQGRAQVRRSNTRLTFGCYNFDIAENCTLSLETEEDITVPPLCVLAVPDQVAIRAVGANSQRNFWLTDVEIGDLI